ncbi:MAG: hypothetical protein M5U14_13905 [Acidimicrobiia bacterium]|nr:hypothetical protein [Acidimicrobiia bacterium]
MLEARRTGRLTVAAFLAAAATAAVLLSHLGRDRTFFYDEWDFVQGRRTGLVDAFLEPHNGHFSAVPVLVWRLLFATVGLDDYRPYRWTLIGFHLLVAGLVVLYVRRRMGPVLGLCAGVVVCFLGSAWQDLLWPFQIGFVGSVAGGLGALLLLEREDRVGDVLAAVCLGVALACSGLGIPLTLGVGAELAWRRRTWPRLWVVAVPGALYGLWYLAYGGESDASLDNVRILASYTTSSAAGAVAALGDLGLDWGRFVAGVLVALLGVRIVSDRGHPHGSWGSSSPRWPTGASPASPGASSASRPRAATCTWERSSSCWSLPRWDGPSASRSRSSGSSPSSPRSRPGPTATCCGKERPTCA